jgi:hypothetical protein
MRFVFFITHHTPKPQRTLGDALLQTSMTNNVPAVNVSVGCIFRFFG